MFSLACTGGSLTFISTFIIGTVLKFILSAKKMPFPLLIKGHRWKILQLTVKKNAFLSKFWTLKIVLPDEKMALKKTLPDKNLAQKGITGQEVDSQLSLPDGNKALNRPILMIFENQIPAW